jgi:hypothetical protein
MTSLTRAAYERQQQERDARHAAGYLLLCGRDESPCYMEDRLLQRAPRLKEAALAAGLIRDEPSPIASVRDRSVTAAGAPFLLLGDTMTLARDFYVRPGQLDALITHLNAAGISVNQD